MRRTISNFSRLKVAMLPAGYLSSLAIVGLFGIGLLDEQHPVLVETVRHGLVMLVMFASFYLVGHLVSELGADDEDDDISPTSPH